MIKLSKWDYGCHMQILKLNPLHCSEIVHIAFNSGILRYRKLIMNIFSKPKILDHILTEHTNDNHYPYIFRNSSNNTKLLSQNLRVDYIWGRPIITQF